MKCLNRFLLGNEGVLEEVDGVVPILPNRWSIQPLPAPSAGAGCPLQGTVSSRSCEMRSQEGSSSTDVQRGLLTQYCIYGTPSWWQAMTCSGFKKRTGCDRQKGERKSCAAARCQERQCPWWDSLSSSATQDDCGVAASVVIDFHGLAQPGWPFCTGPDIPPHSCGCAGSK